MRVLVVHNRYRVHGGEERAVDLQLEAFERSGVPHAVHFEDSGAASAPRAALSILRGGSAATAVADALRQAGADVVHAHNLQPMLGPNALAAARDEGASVVLHLHNFRLFCAIGVAFREGQTCFRCHGRRTLPGLALNCRGSLPESAVYAAGLAAHQPTVMDSVDRFVAPSRFAAEQLAQLGVPRERLSVVPHYVPPDQFAQASRAHEGRYALFAGRLSDEKGADIAVEAAIAAGVPLKVAGDGPLGERLRGLAAGADIDLLGAVPRRELSELMTGAAVLLAPSRGPETFGLSALEAMAAGVPVVAARSGALPEVVGDERCVPGGRAEPFAAALGTLWADPAERARAGAAALDHARGFGEDAYMDRLRDVYRQARERRHGATAAGTGGR